MKEPSNQFGEEKRPQLNFNGGKFSSSWRSDASFLSSGIAIMFMSDSRLLVKIRSLTSTYCYQSGKEPYEKIYRLTKLSIFPIWKCTWPILWLALFSSCSMFVATFHCSIILGVCQWIKWKRQFWELWYCCFVIRLGFDLLVLDVAKLTSLLSPLIRSWQTPSCQIWFFHFFSDFQNMQIRHAVLENYVALTVA